MSEALRIVIGADHRGAPAARWVEDRLKSNGHAVRVLGTCDPTEPCDYPESAWKVGRAIAAGDADRGILICGTGIGMSIAANKIDGVRAAVVHDELTSQLSRAHNDANVLCMSADLLGVRLMESIVDVFLKTTFEGGRHGRRVDKIGLIERGQDPGEPS